MFLFIHVKLASQMLVDGPKTTFKIVFKELFEVFVAVDAAERVVSLLKHLVKCDFSNGDHTYSR